MEAIRLLRILPCGMSNLLVNIIAGALAPFPDMLVVGRADSGADLPAQIRETQADVLILPAAEPGRFAAFEPLLRDFPTLKVVAIEISGKSGYLHELRPYSLPLAELSAEVLSAALRGTVPPAPMTQ